MKLVKYVAGRYRIQGENYKAKPRKRKGISTERSI